MSESPKPERIAKVIARAGVCSRREAEKLIEEGHVKVDGLKITSPALNVTPANVIRIKGKQLNATDKIRLWLYHKPKGLMTTHKDPEGRPTVFEKLPKEMPRVISIGRLDINSEGLLLLTNAGEIARFMELPETGWIRRYRVRAYGAFSPEMIARAAKGVTVEDVKYGPMQIALEKETPSEKRTTNHWYTVSIAEGKNREIRKVFDYLGLTVSRLVRTAYGPFQLGSLPMSEVKEIPHRTLTTLLPKKFFAEK